MAPKCSPPLLREFKSFVSVNPGATALIRIPADPCSRAADFVIPTINKKYNVDNGTDYGMFGGYVGAWN
jgi:hypothetical protein